MSKDIYDVAHTLYLDRVNNFLTLGGFASYYGIPESLATELLTFGQFVHENPRGTPPAESGNYIVLTDNLNVIAFQPPVEEADQYFDWAEENVECGEGDHVCFALNPEATTDFIEKLLQARRPL